MNKITQSPLDNTQVIKHSGNSNKWNERKEAITEKSRDNLRILSTNARSLRNKIDELKAYVALEELDIICITESWVSETHFGDTLSEYTIDGYRLFIYQRLGCGGGIIIYVRMGLTCVENKNLKVSNQIESIWLDIGFSGCLKFRLGVFYQAPTVDAETDELIRNEINRGCESSKLPILIVGDFNFPDIEWETRLGNTTQSRQFIECLQDNYLEQLVYESTMGHNGNILDLVLTNSENLVSRLELGETLGSSDHSIIRFNLHIKKHIVNNNTKVFDLSKGDYDKLREKLCQIKWDHEFQNKNCYEMWDIFKDKLDNISKECIPFKVLRNSHKSKPLWWNDKISRLVKIKKKKFYALKNNNRDEDVTSYRKIRNELNGFIRKCK